MVGTDLEFATLDKLEGEDCGSLLSQSVTHGGHAARGDASNILQARHQPLHSSSVYVTQGNW